MSAPIQEPWLGAMHAAGITSYRQLSAASGLSVETVRAVVLGKRRTVQPETIKGMSEALRVSPEKVMIWLGKTTDEFSPYDPPRESSLLTQRQRDAVDEVIRLLAATNSAQGNEEKTESASATPSSDPVEYAREAEEKLQRVLQSDLAPAASEHEPDPYEGLGEESQEVSE